MHLELKKHQRKNDWEEVILSHFEIDIIMYKLEDLCYIFDHNMEKLSLLFKEAKEFLESTRLEYINPLIDVKDNTAFVRLEGGCQGCSASSATLRQGGALEIKKLVPTIAQVVDVTDHSAGANPYYS